MPHFFPEGNLSLPSDNELRSLQKIVGLFGGSSGGGGGPGGLQQVFAGNWGGANPATFGVLGTVLGSIATDLDAPNPQWLWNGSIWF